MTEQTITSASATWLQAAIAVLADLTGKPQDRIGPDSRLFADLGMDSTNALELLMRLEDHIGVQVDPSTLDRSDLETVNTLLAYFTREAGG